MGSDALLYVGVPSTILSFTRLLINNNRLSINTLFPANTLLIATVFCVANTLPFVS